MARNIKPTYVKRYKKDEIVEIVSFIFSYEDKAMIKFVDYGNSFDIHFGKPENLESLLSVKRRSTYTTQYEVDRKLTSVFNEIIDDKEIRGIFDILQHVFYVFGRDILTVNAINNEKIKVSVEKF